MIKTIIYYLDVLPGVGKTTWAINEMSRRMVAKEVITLYVAPSLDLLKQVRSDLLSLAETQVKNPKSLIRLIEASESGKYGTWVSVAEQLRLALAGGKPFANSTADSVPKSPLGTIIFLTHEAFLKRYTIDKTNVSVIFDEARKFVTKPEEIMLKSPEEEKWFSSLLKLGSEPLLDKDGNETEFYKVVRTKVPKNLNSSLTSTDSRLQYKEIDAIVHIIKNPDIDLYVSENEKKWRRTKFRFHQVVIPSNIFIGFKEVVLMSAFLKDSQMWHFLYRNPNVDLIDIQRDGPYKWAVNKEFFKRTEQIKTKFNLVTIIPLTKQTNPVSLTRYTNGILVPEHAELILKMLLEKEGYADTKDILHLMRNRDNMVLTDKHRSALAILDKYNAEANPFDWYCKIAMKVVNNLKRAGKLKGKPLAVANKKSGLDDHIKKNYPGFELIPINSQGMNIYQHHNCMFFSAAINPDRESKHLYNALLPDYNFSLDHVADVCTQSVTRLSIRDIKSTKRVYVIVPDLAMAKLLREKLKEEPSVNMAVASHYRMTAFNNLNPERINSAPRTTFRTEDERAQATKDKHKKWMSDETNRKVASKRNSISRYRKAIRETGPDENLNIKIRKLEQDIKQLLSLKSAK